MRRLLIVASVSLAVWGCDGSLTGTTRACPATTRITSVSAGTQPRFRWEGDCAMAGLLVVASQGAGTPTWEMQTLTAAQVGSGIRYGQLPRHAVVRHGPAPLQSGTQYVVHPYYLAGGRVVRGEVGAGFIP